MLMLFEMILNFLGFFFSPKRIFKAITVPIQLSITFGTFALSFLIVFATISTLVWVYNSANELLTKIEQGDGVGACFMGVLNCTIGDAITPSLSMAWFVFSGWILLRLFSTVRSLMKHISNELFKLYVELTN